MDRVSWLFAAMNMLDRTVTLDSIPECHNHKILMVTLTVGVHDRVMFSAANPASRMNQIAIPQIFIQLSQRLCKGVNCDARLKIEATQHVIHCVNPTVTAAKPILSERSRKVMAVIKNKNVGSAALKIPIRKSAQGHAPGQHGIFRRRSSPDPMADQMVHYETRDKPVRH